MATTKGKRSRKVPNRFRESAVQPKVSGLKSEPSELHASNIESHYFKSDKVLNTKSIATSLFEKVKPI